MRILIAVAIALLAGCATPTYESQDVPLLQTMEAGTYTENGDQDARFEFRAWISLWDETGANVAQDGTLRASFPDGYGCGAPDGWYCVWEIRSFEHGTVGHGSLQRERLVSMNGADTADWPCPYMGDDLPVLYTFISDDGQVLEAQDSFWWAC